MYIKYKDTRIFYKQQGEGNPLLLLHGFLESSEIWNFYISKLASTRQVICIDLPGHGKSETFAENYTMTELAKCIRFILKKLEIEEVSVVGHSMGGYVGLEMLKNFPMLLKSIMLINSTPADDSVERKKTRERTIQLVEKNKEAFVKMAISNLFTEESRLENKTEIEQLKSIATNMTIESIKNAINCMKNRTNYQNMFRQATTLKTIVGGSNDNLMDISDLRLISKDVGADFKTMTGGHMLPIENKNNLLKRLLLID